MRDEEKYIIEYPSSMCSWEGESAPRPARRKTISLCMIVKNEEEYLGQCLDSVKDIVDEMIVVDTGSTDRTVEIAESRGAKVSYFPWNGSFADARNASLEKATGDWILIMDADEVLSEDDKHAVPKLVQRDDAIGFLFRIKNMVEDYGEPEYQEHFFIRLFANNPDIRYDGKIHEQVRHRVKGAGGEYLFLPIDRFFTLITIYHYGYHRRVFNERHKAERNSKILENILSQEKENGFQHLNLAITYWCAEEYEKAFHEYELARKYVNPKLGFYPMILSGGASVLVALGRGKQAVAWAEEAVKLLPGAPDMRFALASAYEAAGMYEEAIKEYLATLDCGAEHTLHIVHDPATITWKPWNQIGVVYMQQEKFADALKAFEKALELKPATMHLLHNMACAHLKMGNYADAEKYFRQVISSSPETNDFWRLFDILRKEKKHNEMFDLAEEYVMRHADQSFIWEGVGFAFLQENAASLAKLAFKAVVESQASAPGFNNLGVVLMQLGEVDEAVSCFHKALKLDSGYMEARINLAQCCLQFGKPQAAYELLQGMTPGKSGERVLEIRAKAAAACFPAGELAEKTVGDPALSKKIAATLLQQQRWTDALPLLERLIPESPADPDLLFQMGIALMNVGEPEKAATAFSKALTLKPGMNEARAGLLGAQTIMKLKAGAPAAR